MNMMIGSSGSTFHQKNKGEHESDNKEVPDDVQMKDGSGSDGGTAATGGTDAASTALDNASDAKVD